ncbi:hypothetical protein GN316_06865 [Xylophilus sp. Kf1]|nr:hypothetical protein [Xylophilus sp. Kf1]
MLRHADNPDERSGVDDKFERSAMLAVSGCYLRLVGVSVGGELVYLGGIFGDIPTTTWRQWSHLAQKITCQMDRAIIRRCFYRFN